jgi:hypothetical protein
MITSDLGKHHRQKIKSLFTRDFMKWNGYRAKIKRTMKGNVPVCVVYTIFLFLVGFFMVYNNYGRMLMDINVTEQRGFHKSTLFVCWAAWVTVHYQHLGTVNTSATLAISFQFYV